jgi:hypothetical protein
MSAELSVEMINDAKKRQQFILLDGTFSRVNVRDSHNIWNKKNKYIFNVKYRVVGSKKDLMQQLNEIYETDDANYFVTKYIFTSKDYSTNPLYKKEMEEFLERRRFVINVNASENGVKISDITDKIVSSISDIQPKRILSQSLRSARHVSLNARLDDATREGKFLDVTNIKDNGTGSSITNVKTTRKYKSEILNIISGKIEPLIKALNMLNVQEDILKKEIERANMHFRGTSVIQNEPIPSSSKKAATSSSKKESSSSSQKKESPKKAASSSKKESSSSSPKKEYKIVVNSISVGPDPSSRKRFKVIINGQTPLDLVQEFKKEGGRVKKDELTDKEHPWYFKNEKKDDIVEYLRSSKYKRLVQVEDWEIEDSSSARELETLPLPIKPSSSSRKSIPLPKRKN